LSTVIYSVAPKEGGEELYQMLLEHYRDNPNVTVIVDRREGDRRARASRTTPSKRSSETEQRRRIRDRRRARVVGELSSVVTVDG
jgi:hypothetical protein